MGSSAHSTGRLTRIRRRDLGTTAELTQVTYADSVADTQGLVEMAPALTFAAFKEVWKEFRMTHIWFTRYHSLLKTKPAD